MYGTSADLIANPNINIDVKIDTNRIKYGRSFISHFIANESLSKMKMLCFKELLNDEF